MNTTARYPGIQARASTAISVIGRGSLVGLLLFATLWTHASLMPGWTPPLTIQNIVVNGDEAILVVQGGVSPVYLRDDCNASAWNVIDLTSIGGRARLATALLAQATGRQVSLAMQACSAGRPAVTHIQL
jgi:hypothetical protein